MKILTVIGARPQIIKSAAISSKIAEAYRDKIKEVVVHTGQHYDAGMSDKFFTEWKIPVPQYNLEVGSGNHGKQTGVMLQKLEEVIEHEQPDIVLIYGDTNSTLAAAVAASKMHIPVAHIEAGMRSFNKAMPEELNRVLSDHSSTFLFCPTNEAVKNLKNEGFVGCESHPNLDCPHVSNVGDIMYDNAIRYGISDQSARTFSGLKFEPGTFMISTLHRASNTQNAEQVEGILQAINQAGAENGLKVILPIHPRTRAIIGHRAGSDEWKSKYEFICFTEPLGYTDILWCLNHGKLAITDSGGLQKEAAFFNTPSVVLRTETEWVELVDFGLVKLSDSDENSIISSVSEQLKSEARLPENYYGDGNASGRILDTLVAWFNA
jgi:UDP-GlcNAc3NAcA epimerase